MSAAAAWLVAGLVLAALEMVAPGAFLLWIGLAALGTGLIALAGITLHWQVAAFVVLAAILVALVARRVRRHPTTDTVNGPAANVVGQRCRALDFNEGEGRVALGDGQWPARLTAPIAAPPGTSMRVTGIEGTVLLVAPE